MAQRKSRLQVEPLEVRTVPTAGLDWTFGRAGRAIVPFSTDGVGNVVSATLDAQGRTVLLVSQYDAVEVVRLTTAGKPDESFGTHGIVRVPFDPVILPPMPIDPPGGLVPDTKFQGFYPADVAVDGQGRVVVAGSTYANVVNSVPTGGQQVAVLRFTANGMLDPSFDGDGEAILGYGSATGVAIAPDGKILVSGSTPAVWPVEPNGGPGSSMPIVAQPSYAAVFRVTADGSPDTTFDGDGVATFRFTPAVEPWSYDYAADVAVDDLGRVYTVGGSGEQFHIARLTANGQLDATYADDGVADVSFGNPLPVAPSPPYYRYAYASKLVVAGDGTATVGGSVATLFDTIGISDADPVFNGVAVVRLTQAGELDPSFATDGINYLNLADTYLTDLGVDSAGRTLVTRTQAAYAYTGTQVPLVPPLVPTLVPSYPPAPRQPVTVTRLTPDGFYDYDFGPFGVFALPNRLTRTFYPSAVTVQADDKIVLAGAMAGPRGNAATVVRIDPEAPDRPISRPPVAISGDNGVVKIYRPDDNGDLVFDTDVTPFPGYTGPVRVATADLTGDGIDDLIFATGAGRADLRLVDGATGTDLLTDTTFSPYESSFTGGLFVAAADLNGDGIAEVVVSPDTGGGDRVQVLALENGTLVQRDNFFAIDDPDFRGGCRVAVGDLNGDGTPDLAVGAGTGGGPRVALFNGTDLLHMHDAPVKLEGDFFAFPDEINLRGGVFVSAGDVNGDGIAELALGAGDGGGPRVIVTDLNRTPLADFFPDDATLRGGVHVTIKDVDGDGLPELVVGSGANVAAKVQVFLVDGLPITGGADQELDPFAATLLDGVYVG
ncbi:MAG TPA: FG-GAP-like repeat-containing protein [Fimbriiglobus sp.]|jgi:uncharacterized delta-60 repeat protein